MNNYIKQHPLRIYFTLSFIFTWLILSPGVASNLGVFRFNIDGTLLTILGGMGPLLAVVVVTGITDGRYGVRKIFQSMFNWRVRVKWWAAAVLLMALLFALAAIVSFLASGSTPNPNAGVYLDGGSLFLVILLLLLGSFGEEPGWRGFALPKLQQNRKPWKATIILTFFWWLWHLPTYWTLPMAMDSVQQYGFPAAFGIQLIVLLSLSILCTWVYNGSSGSVLMPVLIHAGWNFWSGAFGQEVSLFLLPLFLLASLFVLITSKGMLGLKVNKPFNPTWFEEGFGALGIGACILFSPFLRSWYRQWGATKQEFVLPLPGDEEVSNPNQHTTRAITINAPARKIWPWLLQMGQGRGGSYSYERLENLVGCQMRNADRILPEHQELHIGDKVRLMPEGKGPYFITTNIETGRAIILSGKEPPTTWGFILEKIDKNSTRLIIRYRQNFPPTFGNILIWRVFSDPISFVMERKMLQGIKVRAEQT